MGGSIFFEFSANDSLFFAFSSLAGKTFMLILLSSSSLDSVVFSWGDRAAIYAAKVTSNIKTAIRVSLLVVKTVFMGS